MQLTILGSANAAGVPVYGCDCPACDRARRDAAWRRGPCSALLETPAGRLLIDGGQPNLGERFPPGSLQAILLTHYHMDHVHGLFPLRWGQGPSIPVIGPHDPAGCDDLLKYPGMLDFGANASDGQGFALLDLEVLPLALRHSRPALGYRCRHGDRSLAYLTDTAGLPPASLATLQAEPPDLLVLDCSYPPRPEGERNHNALNDALELHAAIGPGRTLLTHIGHALDSWLMVNPNALPAGVEPARDGQQVKP
jgi:phosphoribosyl 1,2-cyclic phosphate phosphodiesterase